MRFLVTSCKSHEVEVVLALVSCLSVAVLVWFLLAPVLEDLRVRAKRSWAPRKRNHRFAIQHFQAAGVWLARIDSGSAGARPLKMLWLIGILLSTTIRLVAQNTNPTQSTAPPSPLPTPSITGPLEAA